MENRRIKVKKVVVCKDPARQSSWQVNMNPPIDQEQFEIIDRIICLLYTSDAADE